MDSGNLAGALLTLSVGLRDISPSLAARAAAFFDAMNFRFLFDPKRQLFAIGYRLADAESAGRLDASYYDLLASEARLASFIAIAKGEVPEMHWFHLGRTITSVRGAPVLLSWSATLFEYLMPLLLMRSYPNTLLDESCRMAVRAQIDYASSLGVPWGISESAYNLVDRHGVYQYKAFGIPGLGLKRGLGDEVVVAPYATALAVMVEPVASTANLRRLAEAGLEGEYGFFDAIDYTHRGADAPEHRSNPPGVIVPGVPRPSPGHDARGVDQCAAGRPYRRALPRRAADSSDGTAGPGARAAASGDGRATAARRNARRGACGVDPSAPLSLTPHDLSAHAIPVERTLRHIRDQCGWRHQRVARASGDQVAARCDARRGRSVRLFARCPERRRVVGDLSAHAHRAGRIRRRRSRPTA